MVEGTLQDRSAYIAVSDDDYIVVNVSVSSDRLLNSSVSYRYDGDHFSVGCCHPLLLDAGCSIYNRSSSIQSVSSLNERTMMMILLTKSSVGFTQRARKRQ